jgi:RNA polymerase primary sigma factor
MRYGLFDKEPMVLDSIGKQLGITRERVRQIQASALKKLKVIGLEKDLKSFLNY